MTCSYLSHTVQFNKVPFDTWLYDALKVRRMIVAPIYVLKISAKQGSFWPVKSLYTLIQETLNHKEDEKDFLPMQMFGS